MSEHRTDHESGHESPSKRHMLMMMLCCLSPIIVVAVAFAVFPGSPYLGALFLTLCPLSMLLLHLPQVLSRKKKTEKHQH